MVPPIQPFLDLLNFGTFLGCFDRYLDENEAIQILSSLAHAFQRYSPASLDGVGGRQVRYSNKTGQGNSISIV